MYVSGPYIYSKAVAESMTLLRILVKEVPPQRGTNERSCGFEREGISL